jgi:hypothetical protein
MRVSVPCWARGLLCLQAMLAQWYVNGRLLSLNQHRRHELTQHMSVMQTDRSARLIAELCLGTSRSPSAAEALVVAGNFCCRQLPAVCHIR